MTVPSTLRPPGTGQLEATQRYGHAEVLDSVKLLGIFVGLVCRTLVDSNYYTIFDASRVCVVRGDTKLANGLKGEANLVLNFVGPDSPQTTKLFLLFARLVLSNYAESTLTDFQRSQVFGAAVPLRSYLSVFGKITKMWVDLSKENVFPELALREKLSETVEDK
ncbi:hypothetical protein B0T26DRAFT_679981 [Lasiosphaeria miniovina]|uniref:Uncharacterized protein n=1 Tax=Lasiosphaeria miniovina TaxID=1954250 RepID=A0AA39ZZ20_9PEZI|nr:uncharacterized protein B0T26DRAFT_679981 [Lasiosphaeria miniovina]KAK0706273.1 hypothetical protein B0T26DRAFT_679981 [Lasiosphaeria miniovina]